MGNPRGELVRGKTILITNNTFSSITSIGGSFGQCIKMYGAGAMIIKGNSLTNCEGYASNKIPLQH